MTTLEQPQRVRLRMPLRSTLLVAVQAVHHSGLNGAGHAGAGLNHGPGTTTLSRGPLGPPLGPSLGQSHPPHTLSLMQPGNWLCPVGTQLGYSGVWARLYCCLAK